MKSEFDFIARTKYCLHFTLHSLSLFYTHFEYARSVSRIPSPYMHYIWHILKICRQSKLIQAKRSAKFVVFFFVFSSAPKSSVAHKKFQKFALLLAYFCALSVMLELLAWLEPMVVVMVIMMLLLLLLVLILYCCWYWIWFMLSCLSVDFTLSSLSLLLFWYLSVHSPHLQRPPRRLFQVVLYCFLYTLIPFLYIYSCCCYCILSMAHISVLLQSKCTDSCQEYFEEKIFKIFVVVVVVIVDAVYVEELNFFGIFCFFNISQLR